MVFILRLMKHLSSCLEPEFLEIQVSLCHHLGTVSYDREAF